MNDRTLAVEAGARVTDLFATQQGAFEAHPCPAADERRAHLRALKQQLSRYQDVLAEAIEPRLRRPLAGRVDDARRAATTLEINHAISHAASWMKPSRRKTELLFLCNRLRVHYQPKGVVGVIATWNFPIYLAVGPLAAALAAGNRVMIKMPEVTPRHQCGAEDGCSAKSSPRTMSLWSAASSTIRTSFTSLPFNHIVFTGSPAVGTHRDAPGRRRT